MRQSLDPGARAKVPRSVVTMELRWTACVLRAGSEGSKGVDQKDLLDSIAIFKGRMDS